MGSPLDIGALERIRDVEHLEDLLSEPTPGVVETLSRLDGDLLIMGVGGKMGPTLARMARKALDASGTRREVIGVARFTEPGLEAKLQRFGVRTIQADLLDPDQIARLPDAPLVVFMAGMKFGTTGREALTWAVNTFSPGLVGRRYRGSRLVVFSTGNVYGPTPIERGGSKESDPLDPRGEYAMSCVGRERILEYISREMGTPTVLFRLNYAVETRYGVLVDLARMVRSGEPIDLSTSMVNVIWQGDASAMALQALEHAACPPEILNITGPEMLRVREIAEQFGTLLDVPVRFQGSESSESLLSDASKAIGLFGPPRVGVDRLVTWVADWLRRDGPLLDKPTKFEVADGRF